MFHDYLIWFDLLKIIFLSFGHPQIFFQLLVINFWQRRPSMRSTKLSMSILSACNYLQLPPSVFQTPFSVTHQYHLPDQPHNFTQINHKKTKNKNKGYVLNCLPPNLNPPVSEPILGSFPFRLKSKRSPFSCLRFIFPPTPYSPIPFTSSGLCLSSEIYLPF